MMRRWPAILVLLIASTLYAAGAELVVQLPPSMEARSAVAVAPAARVETRAALAGRQIRFDNLLPRTRYDLRIELADGAVLQGVDLAWPTDEPAKPDVGPLDDEDRRQIDEFLANLKAFENRRTLRAIRGDHDRAVLLVELIRDTPFHSAKPGEIIWRMELWCFKNQHGGWEQVPQATRILRRERFPSRTAFERETQRIRWMPELGGLTLAADERKTLDLSAK